MSKLGKVCVMGSFVVDLMMRADRLPVPGETIKGNGFFIGAGGKGSNQGVSASKSGSKVIMITKIGKDEFASIALESFKSNNIDTKYILSDDKNSTGAALIMVDEHTSQNKIIVTLGACNNITDEEIDNAKGDIISSDIFLTQLETNQSAVIRAINIAHSANVPVILNPAPAEHFDEALYNKIDYFTPNETEAEFFSGIMINSIEDAERVGKYFIDKGVKNCVFTLGSKGSFLYNKTTSRLYPPYVVKVVDTTGAGDAFNGGLATALSEGKNINDAIQFANATASLSVTKIGTAKAMPERAEIDELIKSGKIKV